jgi:WD40 repeat protein
MNKIILTALIFLTFGCKNEHTVSLENDPIINEYFNINETQDLSKILLFFENQISTSKDSKNIIDSYELFFKNLKPEMKPEEINLNISFNDQENFFASIDPDLFNEIWYYRTDYNPIEKDSVTSIHYKWKGKYFDFLFAVSEKDKAIEKYFEDFTAVGDISPSVLAYSMMDFQQYDLNFERIRLIIAINYLTFNEQLRLMKNKKNE